MDVVIVGEDQVTKEILIRLINFVGDINILYGLPARGGRIKSLINNFNKLSVNNPVLLLTDLDQYCCAPELLSNWFKDYSRNPSFHIRVAIDEAEAWLMADREGFSNYFKVPLSSIPNSIVHSRLSPVVNEMNFPYKSSFYLLREIIPQSRNQYLRESLIPKHNSKKGELYNSALVPFIRASWNIENAMTNSYSLRKTIQRFRNL